MAARIIEIKFDATSGGYTAEVQRMTDQNRKFTKAATDGAAQTIQAFTKVQTALSGVGAQLVGLVGIGSLIALAKQAVDAAGKIQDLADQTGLSAQTLSGLKTPIEQAGGSLDDFANGVVRLQKSLVDSRDKQDGFALRMRDLLKLSSDPEKFLEAFAKKLAAIENPAVRTAFALEAASRGGAKLAPIFLQIAEHGLDKFRNSASAMSNETITHLDELGDSVTAFKNNLMSSFAAGIGSLGDFSAAVRGFGEAVGSTMAFIVQHKEMILLLGAGVAALTGHWLTAAAALAAYLGLSNQYRGDLGALNAINEKQLAIEKQLLVVEEARRLGQRSGMASDFVRDKILAEQKTIASQKQELMDRIRLENDKPLAAKIIPGLGAGAGGDAAKKAAAFVEELQTKIGALRNEIANPLHDANTKLLGDFEDLEKKAAKFGSPTITNLISIIKSYTLAQIERNKADEEHKAIIEQVTQLNKFLAESENAELAEKESARAAIEAEFQLKARLLDLDLDRLRALGLGTDADRQQLENLILLNEERKRALELAAEEGRIFRVPGEFALLDKETTNARIRVQQLGQSAIDIAGEVSRVVTDITSAVINGTLKWADIGKSILASFVRLALEQFTGFLQKMQTQARAAQFSGAGGGAFGLAGGLLPGSQAPAGVEGPLMANGSFFSGGGGLFSSLGGLFNAFGGGSGQQGGGQGGGGGGGGLMQSIFGSTSSLLPNIIGSGLLGLGVGSVLGGGNTGSRVGGTLGGIAGSLVGLALGNIANLILPGIGSIIGALLGGLFQEIPNPSVWVKTIIKFYYDALTSSFGAFTKATILRFTDIKGSAAAGVLAEHQKTMDTVAKQFVDILNAFPVAVHQFMEPALADANKTLDFLLGSKKYTEGGSRNIRQELDDLLHHEAPAAFFYSLRQTIGVGLNETLKLAGFDFSDIIGRNFAAPTDALNRNSRNYYGGQVDAGYSLGTDKEANDKFLAAVTKMAQFSGSLGAISPRGVQQFLTASDNTRLEAEIRRVFESPTTEAFGTAVESMLERIKPVSDFLAKAVTDASNIFGRGLIAALDAATSSQANEAFLKSLGEGVKDIIFQGITESFIASAQFTDLLAPIQRVIREFTQQAISTGETPDIDAFRRAIMPGIEDVTTRAATLRPLLEELQKLGIDVKKALGILAAASGGAFGDINITIEGGLNDDRDGANLARRIEQILRPSLPPPT